MPAIVKLLEEHFLGQGVDKYAQNPIKCDPWPLLVQGEMRVNQFDVSFRSQRARLPAPDISGPGHSAVML